MKIASNNLYDLVRSLTKSEKRYLKVQASNGQKDYIQLMDALLGQTSFDEGQLIEEYKEANFTKHLAVNKRYLYDLILKSLERFGQKTIKAKIFEKISASEVLLRKGFAKQGLNELQKGKKLALKYELFDSLIVVFDVEKRLLAKSVFKGSNMETVNRIFEEEKNGLKELQNTNEYWFLAQQIAQFQMRFQKVQNEAQKEEMEKIIEHPKLQNVELATNFKSKIYFYQANANFQFILGNVEEANEINKSFLELLENYPRFLKIYAERYLATLNNMLIDSLVIGRYHLLDEGINRLLRVPKMEEFKNIKNIESRIFRQRYLLLINWCLQQKDFKKGLDWIPDIELGLQRFEKEIEKHHRITFYYLIAYLLFFNRNFDDALAWNNKILNDSKEDVVKEIYHFARSLNLLIHFELGNIELLKSLLSSTPKYLRRRRPVYNTEKALFRFLSKILNEVDKAEKENIRSLFKKELLTLFENQKEKRVFNYIDLNMWLDNK